jgi:PAS domain S-box-containing protein
VLRRQVRRQTDVIRRRLERERALEEQFRELVANANDLIFTHDLSGRFVSLNRAALELLEHNEAEARSLRLEDVVVPAHRERLATLLSLCHSSQSVAGYEVDVQTRTGRRRTLEISTRLLRHAGDAPVLQSIARDVTGRRRAEAQLRRSAARLAEAQRIGQVGSWEFDLTTGQMEVSVEARRLYGLTHTEPLLSAESLFGCVHPEDQPAVRAALDAALRGDRAFNLDHRLVLPDRSVRVVHGQAEVVLGPDRRPARILGTVQDVTDRRQFEQQLLKLSRAIEQSPSAVVITDGAGRIEYANPRFLVMTGFAIDELLGRSARALEPAGEGSEAHTRLWDAIEHGREWHGELQNRRQCGEIYWASAKVSPIRNERGEETHRLWMQEDITDRRNLEGQLQQAQKMESVGRLAAGVAHDFNNVLTVIQGHTNLLQQMIEGPGDVQASLREITTAADRAADLTRQLLAFSRKQVMRTQVLQINDLVATAARLLARLIGEDIELEVVTGKSLPNVKADPGMLEQVLMNLAVNARDAMPGGGRIILRTDCVDVSEFAARQDPEARPGRFVRVAMEDSGCGMDPATLARLFEPFFTTKEVGRGTGLGLASVYGIVKQHNGWVEVTSRVGAGSRFRIYLPAVESAASSAAPRPVPAATKGTETILVVEDEESLRQLASRVLMRHGYRTVEAASGREALDRWEDYGDQVDLVLTDMVMPEGVSGRELAARLRSRRPGLRMIFTTGYSAELTAAGLDAEEGRNLLQKPYTPDQLVETVRRCLDS